MKRYLFITLTTIAFSILLLACAPPNLDVPPTPNQDIPPTEEVTDMVNPAAKYCIDQGYRHEIRHDEAGNEVGVCIFDDGSECDAWAYFRGECGPEEAEKPRLNLVEVAGLTDIQEIEITQVVSPKDDSDHTSRTISITDPADIQALLAPLDAPLPMVPPTRCCYTIYELKFMHESGQVDAFRLGSCGLYGDQSYWQGLVLATPAEFTEQLNRLLEAAGWQL